MATLTVFYVDMGAGFPEEEIQSNKEGGLRNSVSDAVRVEVQP